MKVLQSSLFALERAERASFFRFKILSHSLATSIGSGCGLNDCSDFGCRRPLLSSGEDVTKLVLLLVESAKRDKGEMGCFHSEDEGGRVFLV